MCELTSLWLIEFNEKSLEKVEKIKTLENLNLKTASIESLAGIEKLDNIRSVSLGNCKKLASIAGLNSLKKMERLTLDKCQAVNDYNSLTDLPNLGSLELIDCGSIPSIKFIDNLIQLERLSLAGNTVIADGDLVQAKRIKNIEHKHWEHYNIKLENPEFDGLVKENLKKLRGGLNSRVILERVSKGAFVLSSPLSFFVKVITF